MKCNTIGSSSGTHRPLEIVHVSQRCSDVDERNNVVRVNLKGAFECGDGVNNVVPPHVNVALEEVGVG
jgi:hypothetical protein